MATDRAYHHGDLRASLLSRALEVVESQGFEAVSLRALAEELGVSRGAPYRHFPERDLLLAELASSEFERLGALIESEPANDEPPGARLFRAAQQFLQFVAQHPQLFRLMYESGLLQRIDAFPKLAEAQDVVYNKIYSLYAAAKAHSGDMDDRATRAGMIGFWSTIFGYAKIRQSALLQSYMVGDLSSENIETQILSTAIGADVITGMK